MACRRGETLRPLSLAATVLLLLLLLSSATRSAASRAVLATHPPPWAPSQGAPVTPAPVPSPAALPPETPAMPPYVPAPSPSPALPPDSPATPAPVPSPEAELPHPPTSAPPVGPIAPAPSLPPEPASSPPVPSPVGPIVPVPSMPPEPASSPPPPAPVGPIAPVPSMPPEPASSPPVPAPVGPIAPVPSLPPVPPSSPPVPSPVGPIAPAPSLPPELPSYPPVPSPGAMPPELPCPPTSMPPVGPIAPVPSSTPAPSPAPRPSAGIKGGYFLSWRRWSFPPSSIDFASFTHVCYAFVQLDPASYRVVITSDDDQALPDFTATLHRQDPPLKALLSMGGWNPGSTTFSEMAGSNLSRAVFISSSIAVARKYGLDGLDLDWEYPANPGQMADLGDLYGEWRAAVDREASETGYPPLLLTSAVYYAAHLALDGVPRSYPVGAMLRAVDFVSPMCYDFHGSWDDVTGAPAALYDPTGGDLSASYGIRSWVEAGMPPEKVAMGMPLYGKSWELQDPARHGIGAPGSGNGTPTYAEVVEQNEGNGAREVFDGATVSTYSYAGRAWIGYDSPRSVAAKVEYARRLGLGGYFFWALSYDRNWTISRTASTTWDS